MSFMGSGESGRGVSIKGREHNNYSQGKTGSKAKVKPGPINGVSMRSNPRKGGGINRATQGHGAGASNY